MAKHLKLPLCSILISLTSLMHINYIKQKRKSLESLNDKMPTNSLTAVQNGTQLYSVIYGDNRAIHIWATYDWLLSFVLKGSLPFIIEPNSLRYP